MGVAYERWLIAKGNVLLPAAATVAKLIELLREDKWIVDPIPANLERLRFEGARESFAKQTGGYAVRTVENKYGADRAKQIVASTEALPASITADWLDSPDREEVRLVWPVSSDDQRELVKYPLTHRPDGGVSYALEVHRAPEYVYPVSDTIGALPITCTCGEELDFEWDEEEVVPAFRSANGIFAECDECSRTFDPAKGSAKIQNPFDGSSEHLPGGAAYRFALKVDCGKSFVKDPKLAFAPELVALVEKAFGRTFYEVGALY
jgi:hypothetical protein